MLKQFGTTAVLLPCLVVLVISQTPSTGQSLLSSFENDLSSTIGVNWEGDWTATPQFSAVGATEGSTAFVVKHAPTWVTGGLALKGGLPLAEMTAQHGFLQIDFTSADVGTGGDGASPSWRQVFAVFNMNGSWNQNVFDIPVAPDDGTSLTSTYTLDIASAGIQRKAQTWVTNFPTATDPYFELFLIWQGADQGVVEAGNYAPTDKLVDAADFTVWRDTLGGTNIPNETVTLGIVDSADYDEWKANFGDNYSRIETNLDNIRFVNASAGSVSAAAVPEPASLLLAIGLTLGVASLRRCSR